MTQTGRYRLGFGPLSMIAAFIVLSVCAIVSAFHQVTPEYPMSLFSLMLINEGMVLLTALLYGITAHFVIAIINRIKGNY